MNKNITISKDGINNFYIKLDCTSEEAERLAAKSGVLNCYAGEPKEFLLSGEFVFNTVIEKLRS